MTNEISNMYDDGSNDWSPLTKKLLKADSTIISQKEVWLRCFSNLICNGTLSSRVNDAANIADGCLEIYNRRFNA